jgi:hypothetical protein
MWKMDTTEVNVITCHTAQEVCSLHLQMNWQCSRTAPFRGEGACVFQ